MNNYFSDVVVNPQRLDNIQTFGQLADIDKVRENITKQLLTLVDVNLANADTANRQTQNQQAEGAPQLAPPKVVSQETLLQRVVNIQKNGVDSSVIATDNPPSNSRSDYRSDALLTLSTLNEVLKTSSLAELKNKVEALDNESTALREVGYKMIAELETALEQLRQSTTDVESATAQFKETQSNLKSLQDQSTTIKEKIAELATKKSMLPNPPMTVKDIELAATYDQELDKLVKQDKSIASEIKGKQQDVASKQSVLEEAVRYATTSAESVDEKITKTNNYIDALGRRAHSSEINEKVKNAISELVLLSGILTNLIGKMNLANIKSDQETLEKINETSRLNSEKKAKEMEESNKKAEAANKAASCASKILSAIMMVFSAILLVLSFGIASPLALVVGVIGLAISVADVALEATGQATVMQQLAGSIAKSIKATLLSCGVEKSKADMIANILGMILGAVVFIAMSLLSFPNIGKNIASAAKNVGSMIANMGKTLGKIASKIIPDVFKTAFSTVGSALSKALTPLLRGLERAQHAIKDSQSLQKISHLMQTSETVRSKAQVIGNAVENGLSATNAIVPGSLNVAASMYRINVKEAEAHLLLAMENTDLINKILTGLLQTATSMQKNLIDMIDRMFGTMASTLQQQISTIDRAYSATQLQGKMV